MKAIVTVDNFIKNQDIIILDEQGTEIERKSVPIKNIFDTAYELQKQYDFDEVTVMGVPEYCKKLIEKEMKDYAHSNVSIVFKYV